MSRPTVSEELPNNLILVALATGLSTAQLLRSVLRDCRDSHAGNKGHAEGKGSALG